MSAQQLDIARMWIPNGHKTRTQNRQTRTVTSPMNDQSRARTKKIPQQHHHNPKNRVHVIHTKTHQKRPTHTPKEADNVHLNLPDMPWPDFGTTKESAHNVTNRPGWSVWQESGRWYHIARNQAKCISISLPLLKGHQTQFPAKTIKKIVAATRNPQLRNVTKTTGRNK